MSDKNIVVGFAQKPASLTGPSTFKKWMIEVLRQEGHRVVFKNRNVCPDVIFIFQSIKDLGWLLKCKASGSTVVQRLDGLNWRHRAKTESVRHLVMGELRNRIASLIRSYVSDKVVYQSEFIKGVWNKKEGCISKDEKVIHNGTKVVSLPKGYFRKDNEELNVIAVEGRVQNDQVTRETLVGAIESPRVNRVKVLGSCSERFKSSLESYRNIEFLGMVKKKIVRRMMRTSDAFLCLEINPPCPNAVIEAMVHGLPIIGFDTGSVAELVPPSAGSIAPYTADPWNLEMPEFNLLKESIQKVHKNIKSMSVSSRKVAQESYDIKDVVSEYVKFSLE